MELNMIKIKDRSVSEENKIKIRIISIKKNLR